MEAAKYILWSSSIDTSEAGIKRFCRLNAGRYGKTVEEMMALPLSMLLPRMWDEAQAWRMTAYGALNVSTDMPILVISDIAGDGLLSKPETSCSVLSGTKLSQILDVRSGISTTFYSDGSNIWCRDLTENGPNYHLFRELTTLEGITDFSNRVTQGEAFTEAELDEFSKSLAPRIHAIYGWPKPKPSSLEEIVANANRRLQKPKNETQSPVPSR